MKPREGLDKLKNLHTSRLFEGLTPEELAAVPNIYPKDATYKLVSPEEYAALRAKGTTFVESALKENAPFVKSMDWKQAQDGLTFSGRMGVLHGIENTSGEQLVDERALGTTPYCETRRFAELYQKAVEQNNDLARSGGIEFSPAFLALLVAFLANNKVRQYFEPPYRGKDKQPYQWVPNAPLNGHSWDLREGVDYKKTREDQPLSIQNALIMLTSHLFTFLSDREVVEDVGYSFSWDNPQILPHDNGCKLEIAAKAFSPDETRASEERISAFRGNARAAAARLIGGELV